MSKYIKLFKNHAQYETFIGGGGDTPFIKPNVSHCIAENEVHYNPTWDKKYFTTVARGNGAISFNILKSMGTDKITSISYSTDNGATWTTTPNQGNKEENLSITVNVNEGDKILWKGIAETLGIYNDEEGSGIGSFFSSTAKFDVAGNVMSLIYGDNYKNKITIEKEATFCNLFSDCNLQKTCGIVNAKNLSLPATTLAGSCYWGMFNGCTSLTTAPELPATTLASDCYGYMFYGCTSLTSAPELPVTTLATYCYEQMFSGCTNLTTAPELPATTLASDCYEFMFSGCTNLVNAPVLPATTLANYCYWGMFIDCTNLTTAPVLPATTLAGWCYEYMFKNCTSLTTAPELPATTLVQDCYNQMFYGCTNLNYIKCLATDISAVACLNSWVSNVSSTGTFVKAASMTSWRTGISGIPKNWNVQDATE